MPSIELNNLSKTYNVHTQPAVRNLDLKVNDGEFMCLLGPSGCGKTTILRMIAGIEPASGGAIRIGDRTVDSIQEGCYVSPEKRRVGLVFQSYALWPHMTVRANVEFGLKLQKMSKSERLTRCQNVMEKLRIAEYEDRYPAQLSGGQQQRVALARMLVVNPDVLLLDEPLSNLDANLRLEMRAELRRIHETFGTTIVFVSHDQWEAMTLATTIAVLKEGELQQIGSPNDIYSHPANQFVAEFIGTPKINQIRLNKSGSALASHLQLRVDVHTQCCAIRPEAIELGEKPSHDAIAMRIENIIPTGGTWVIELVRGEDRLLHSTQIPPQWQTGDSVYCRLPDYALHLFDQHGRSCRTQHDNKTTSVTRDTTEAPSLMLRTAVA